MQSIEHHWRSSELIIDQRKEKAMGGFWDPRDYEIEDQLLEMVNGRDVATSGDEVLKGYSSGDVGIFWPSDSEKGHGHGVIRSDGSIEIKHY